MLAEEEESRGRIRVAGAETRVGIGSWAGSAEAEEAVRSWRMGLEEEDVGLEGRDEGLEQQGGVVFCGVGAIGKGWRAQRIHHRSSRNYECS